jgi:hypothetical protein
MSCWALTPTRDVSAGALAAAKAAVGDFCFDPDHLPEDGTSCQKIN